MQIMNSRVMRCNSGVVFRYVAKVLEVDEDSGEVLVHFDRWSSRYDEYITINAGRLRKLTASKLKELQKERDPVSLLFQRRGKT